MNVSLFLDIKIVEHYYGIKTGYLSTKLYTKELCERIRFLSINKSQQLPSLILMPGRVLLFHELYFKKKP